MAECTCMSDGDIGDLVNFESSPSLDIILNRMKETYVAALVSIYDYLKLVDNEQQEKGTVTEFQKLNDNSLVEMLFRKLKAYDIDLSEVEGLEHFKKYYENN